MGCSSPYIVSKVFICFIFYKLEVKYTVVGAVLQLSNTPAYAKKLPSEIGGDPVMETL